MTDKTLKEHVKKCGDLKAKIDDLTALFNKEKEYIEQALDDRQTADFRTTNYIINYIKYDKKSVDTARLKKDHLYEQYLKTCKSTRFTVKAI